MTFKFKAHLFVAFIYFYSHVNAKKDIGKFRMDKINFIWEKAINQVEKDRLEKLQVILINILNL